MPRSAPILTHSMKIKRHEAAKHFEKAIQKIIDSSKLLDIEDVGKITLESSKELSEA